MIAVIADELEYPIVREFFELFKTPWEFHRDGQRYDVLICSGDQLPVSAAQLVIVYGSVEKSFDRENNFQVSATCSATILSSELGRMPIYGRCLTFKRFGRVLLKDESARQPVAIESETDGQKQVRIGYDLFQEIRHLLVHGQPSANALMPTLEMHIALLRNLITASGLSLVEVPPVPVGYNFIACLTHDVDHVGVRNHKFDHTMFGFLYRATIGSVVNFFQGRKSLRQLATNWRAALSLPFVHLGLAKDFWFQFAHYLKIESGFPSTFFFIPKRGESGVNLKGGISPKRAACYDVAELTDDLRELQSAGCEIGVHGIDAWRDEEKGREEMACISKLTGKSEFGVRMHWLYFDEQSPAVLERAGFSYDSTVGFNEAVGYRAGTTQAFKPLQTEKLLELPMHVMDTALFYPSHMNLSSENAAAIVGELSDNVAKFGGVLTVNWHDRSIAPERLWDGFYIQLLDDLKDRGACFLTAAQTTAWFRARRSVTFEKLTPENDAVSVNVSVGLMDDDLPELKIRAHHPGNKGDRFSEVAFNRSVAIRIPLPTSQSAKI